ncbi:MAG: hypothetical protein LBI41_04370 [Lactobacillales bacterium]|jgi:cystine transport system substrate-binding protein|nr:hypothetical protein [Lactobacillales bacterium]
MDRIKQEIAEIQADFANIADRINAAEQMIEKRAESANEQMRALQLQNDYKAGIKALFSSRNFSEFLRSVCALTLMQQSQREEIQSLVKKREELERLKREKAERIATLEQRQNDLIVKQQQMDKQIADFYAQLVAQDEDEFLRGDVKGMQSNALNSIPRVEFKNQSDDVMCCHNSFVANATAYSCEAASMGRFTAFGIDLWTNPRVVAVDPNIIPLGTMVEIVGYGIYIAGDTGSAIKGNHIDIHFSTYQQSCEFGRQDVIVRIL